MKGEREEIFETGYKIYAAYAAGDLFKACDLQNTLLAQLADRLEIEREKAAQERQRAERAEKALAMACEDGDMCPYSIRDLRRPCDNEGFNSSDPCVSCSLKFYLSQAQAERSQLREAVQNGDGSEEYPFTRQFIGKYFKRYDSALSFGVCERDEGYEITVDSAFGKRRNYYIGIDGSVCDLDTLAGPAEQVLSQTQGGEKTDE